MARESGDQHSISRRMFLLKAVGAAALIGGGYYWGSEEIRRVSVEKVTVVIPGLPRGLVGLTVGHFSDLHFGFGYYNSRARVRKIIELINAQEPELIVFTGDLMDRSVSLRKAMEISLSGLRARYGVYSVFGNHDHDVGLKFVGEVLSRDGILVLRNQNVLLQRGGERFLLAGVDDPLTGKPDLVKALQSDEPVALKVLLAHTPDFVQHAASYGVHVQLSGHSHGGQIHLPLIGGVYYPRMARRYREGLGKVEEKSTLVYTNRGLGTTVLPVRLGCLPELTLLKFSDA